MCYGYVKSFFLSGKSSLFCSIFAERLQLLHFQKIIDDIYLFFENLFSQLFFEFLDAWKLYDLKTLMCFSFISHFREIKKEHYDPSLILESLAFQIHFRSLHSIHLLVPSLLLLYRGKLLWPNDLQNHPFHPNSHL